MSIKPFLVMITFLVPVGSVILAQDKVKYGGKASAKCVIGGSCSVSVSAFATEADAKDAARKKIEAEIKRENGKLVGAIDISANKVGDKWNASANCKIEKYEDLFATCNATYDSKADAENALKTDIEAQIKRKNGKLEGFVKIEVEGKKN